jgi:hypothetical protein
MGLHVSHRNNPEVPQKSDVCTNTERSGGDTVKIVQIYAHFNLYLNNKKIVNAAINDRFQTGFDKSKLIRKE